MAGLLRYQQREQEIGTSKIVEKRKKARGCD